MIKELSNFTQLSLSKASEEFLKGIGLWYRSLSEEPIHYSDYYNRKLPAGRTMPVYASVAFEDIKESYFIGVVNNRYNDGRPYNASLSDLAAEGRYESILVFACDAIESAHISRGKISALTRAFNVISAENPVILVIRQGNRISLSTCERAEGLGDRPERIGKVTTLRDINCSKPHPGHLQILEKIAKNVRGSKSFEDLHKRWQKSFSIDVISDLFFDEYKTQYEDIIEYITGKRIEKVGGKWKEVKKGEPCQAIMQGFGVFHNPEKMVRDYVKKLMGRLVFIQFLQKKRWMGCPAGEAWGNGDEDFLQNVFLNSTHKDSFVDDVLEPLFNDINTKRDGDLVSNPELGNIKIPYLNGGLFEPDECDRIPFPIEAKYIKNLFDFFSRFNFTIDENAPYDAEISVDPEMLGRIFENLLEENKEKGAFYTPKEVVQYMCREAIISYLQEDVPDTASKESIRNFVSRHNIDDLKSSLVYSIDNKLRSIKICDPAIGSGAFPMGMLRELYECRYAIRGEEGETPSQIKKDIIQNSIYGVDIERGAVDIARLRFWLSLIIDEDTPHTLPNMDFKIMQGNSLLEEYEGVNLCGLSLNEQKKQKSKKGEVWQQTLAFDEQYSLINIQNAILSYYNTDTHDKKVELREIINNNVKTYIFNLRGCTPDIKEKLESLPIPNDLFFLWHIYFKEVFDRGGFDIVIGNPPYGVSIKGLYREAVVRSLGAVPDYEIYYYFVELAKTLIRENGTLSYIIPNTWLFNQFARDYRTNLFASWEMSEILDCSQFRIFNSADVRNTVIRFVKKNTETNSVGFRNTKQANTFEELISEPSSFVSRENVCSMNQNWGLVFRLDEETISLVTRIKNYGQPLTSYFPEISQGLIAYDKYTGQDPEIIKNRAFHYDEYHDGLKKMLWGEDVTRFALRWNGKEWIDYCDGIANPRNPKFFCGKRLLVREITNPSIYATITQEELYHDPAIIVVLDNPSSGVSLETVLGILNSKLASFYHFNYSPKATKGSFPKILVQDIKDFPIPSIDVELDTKIKDLVSEIQRIKEHDMLADTSSFENQINKCVYELYRIGPGEESFIERSFA